MQGLCNKQHNEASALLKQAFVYEQKHSAECGLVCVWVGGWVCVCVTFVGSCLQAWWSMVRPLWVVDKNSTAGNMHLARNFFVDLNQSLWY